jgi:hypothetical protein
MQQSMQSVFGSKDLLGIIGKYVCNIDANRRSFVLVNKHFNRFWYFHLAPLQSRKAINSMLEHLMNIVSGIFTILAKQHPLLSGGYDHNIVLRDIFVKSKADISVKKKFWERTRDHWPKPKIGFMTFPIFFIAVSITEELYESMREQFFKYKNSETYRVLRDIMTALLQNPDHPPQNLDFAMRLYEDTEMPFSSVLDSITREIIRCKYPHGDRLVPYIDNFVDLSRFVYHSFSSMLSQASLSFLQKLQKSCKIGFYIDKAEFWYNTPNFKDYIEVGLEYDNFLEISIKSGNPELIGILCENNYLNILNPTVHEIRKINKSYRSARLNLASLALMDGYSLLFSVLKKTDGFNGMTCLKVIGQACLNKWNEDHIIWLLSHSSVNTTEGLLEFREECKRLLEIPSFQKKIPKLRITSYYKTICEMLGEMIPYEAKGKKARLRK